MAFSDTSRYLCSASAHFIKVRAGVSTSSHRIASHRIPCACVTMYLLHTVLWRADMGLATSHEARRRCHEADQGVRRPFTCGLRRV